MDDKTKNDKKKQSKELKLIQERNNFQTYAQRLELRIKHNKEQFNQKYSSLNQECIRLNNKVYDLETEIKVKDELLSQKSTSYIHKTIENEKLKDEISKLRKSLKSQLQSNKKPVLRSTNTIPLTQSYCVRSETSVSVASSVSSYSTSPSEPEPQQNQHYLGHGLQPNNKNRSKSMPKLSSPPLKKHKITKAIPLKPLPPNIPKSKSNSSISDLRIRVNSFEDEQKTKQPPDHDQTENDEYELPLQPPFIHRKSSTQVSTLSEQAVHEPFPLQDICDTPPINPALSPICEDKTRDEDVKRDIVRYSVANSNSKDKLSLNMSDDNILINDEWNESIANSDEDDNISFNTFQSNNTKIEHNMIESDNEELILDQYGNLNSNSNQSEESQYPDKITPRDDTLSVASQDTEQLLQDSFNHSKFLFHRSGSQSDRFSFAMDLDLEQSRYLMDNIQHAQNVSITLDEMRLQHALSLNEDLDIRYGNNYSPESQDQGSDPYDTDIINNNDNETDNKQQIVDKQLEEMSIMTDNNYLLMDINNNFNNKLGKFSPHSDNKSGHFSQISNGNASNCDVVVKAPIKFSTAFHSVMDQTKNDKCHNNGNANNTDCDDEKAPIIPSSKQDG